jgi:hypothetical protein
MVIRNLMEETISPENGLKGQDEGGPRINIGKELGKDSINETSVPIPKIGFWIQEGSLTPNPLSFCR